MRGYPPVFCLIYCTLNADAISAAVRERREVVENGARRVKGGERTKRAMDGQREEERKRA